MLKKVLQIKLKVIGAIALGLGLVQIISAYFFGVIAEKQLNLQFKHLTTTAVVKVVSRKYVRGWFGADEKVELAVNNQILKNMVNLLPGMDKESANSITNADYRIKYSTHITHGLFAGWLHGNLLPTIAYAQTNINFPDNLQKILNKFFDNRQALEIDNLLYLNKSGKYMISSPRFNYDEALSGVKVVWGGLNLKVRYNNKFDHFATRAEIPLFDMDAPTKGKFNLTNFEYISNSEYSQNNIKVGSTDLKLANFKIAMFESNNIHFKFGEAVKLFTGVNTADFLNGIDAIDPTNFTISNISYSALSQDQNDFFNAKAKAGFSALISNKRQYGPMNFDFSIEHVAAPQFSKLADDLNNAAGEDQASADNREKTIALLKANMTPIFAKQPVLRLNAFNLLTPSGPIAISGWATTYDFEPADMNDQSKFMQKIKIDVQFSVPKPILAYFFLLQMKYFLTAGNAQMDQQSSDALAKVVNILLDNQLQVWLKKGYMHESNNLLSANINMESGIVSLNGIATK